MLAKVALGFALAVVSISASSQPTHAKDMKCRLLLRAECSPDLCTPYDPVVSQGFDDPIIEIDLDKKKLTFREEGKLLSSAVDVESGDGPSFISGPIDWDYERRLDDKSKDPIGEISIMFSGDVADNYQDGEMLEYYARIRPTNDNASNEETDFIMGECIFR